VLVALAAEQQVRLAAGLRDVAVAGAEEALVLVAVEEILAQATDRLGVAEPPRRAVRFLLIAVDVVPARGIAWLAEGGRGKSRDRT